MVVNWMLSQGMYAHPPWDVVNDPHNTDQRPMHFAGLDIISTAFDDYVLDEMENRIHAIENTYRPSRMLQGLSNQFAPA